jgi:tetratricopeptide (TPR) repeat protein
MPPTLIAEILLAQTNLTQAEAALQKALELDPGYRPAQVQLAQVYVATKRTDQALEKFNTLATKNTNDIAALLQMALIHSAASNYSKARDVYERILTVNPRFIPALNNLAYLYSEHLGDLKRALELARKCRELAPNDPASADTLGWTLFRQGQLAQALSLLKECAEKLPNEPEVQYHLGMVHYQLGEEQPARVAFQDALQLGRTFPGREVAEQRLALLNLDPKAADAKTRAELDRELSRNPSDPVILSRLAAIYEREGDFDKAISTFERALKANPASATLMIRLASLYSGSHRDVPKALELARSARTLAPDDPGVAHALGRLAYQSGDHAWALSVLSDSARKLPNDPDVQLDLALAQFAMGQVPSASESAQRALSAGQNSARAREARRLLAFLSILAKPETAKTVAPMIQAALKQSPDDAPALAAAACLEEQQGNLTVARDLYEKLLQRLPGFVPAHRQLAFLYAGKLKDPKKAFDSATKAREAFPTDPDVARTLGLVVYERKDYSRAAQLLTEASLKRPTDADLFYYLGLSQYQLKQRDQSKAALNRALSLNIPAPLAGEAKRILTELK